MQPDHARGRRRRSRSRRRRRRPRRSVDAPPTVHPAVVELMAHSSPAPRPCPARDAAASHWKCPRTPYRPSLSLRPRSAEPGGPMIIATGVELRAGARCCSTTPRSASRPGDRVGLVGRNGAGKTTLTRVLAGEAAARGRARHPLRDGRLPAAGPAHRRPGRAGPRPDPVRPRAGRGHPPDARDRGRRWPAPTRRPTTRAMERYGRLEAEFTAAGGYAAESEAAALCVQPRAARAGAGPAARHPLRRPAAAGRAGPDPVHAAPTRCCWTSRPTTWTPTRSPGCAATSARYRGGLVVISHDVGLLEHCVNRVFHLDANRAELDIYNVGWRAYLQQRETDERRRQRERANAEKKAAALHGPGRPDAGQGHQGHRRAEHGPPRRAAAGRPGGGAPRRQGRQAALPRAGCRAAGPR